MVGVTGAIAPETSGHPVPTMGRSGSWAALAAPTFFGLVFLGGLTNPKGNHSPLLAAFLAVYWVLTFVAVLNARTGQVTLAGTTVEVHSRWSQTRFDLGDVRWVLDTVASQRGPLRVDGAERTVLGRRLPRLVPWPQLVATSVHPAFWVRRAGVPESRVRGGGLTARRRGLR